MQTAVGVSYFVNKYKCEAARNRTASGTLEEEAEYIYKRTCIIIFI